MTELNSSGQVVVIGAGISGLIAAYNLEQYGYTPLVLEASDRAGGRVKTDLVDGYQLDRGFQVLLEAYPMAKKYLDYESLDLQPLAAGALIYSNGKEHRFGDPRRDASLLLPTAFSSMATLGDKLKIFQLNNQLKSEDADTLFRKKEKTTAAYLKEQGFSQKVINNFMRPFFAGIFLEENLDTSSRMFEFVFKCFGEGRAVIPKDGIEAIARQLVAKLHKTTFRFNTWVRSADSQQVTLESGEKIGHDFLIIATNPEKLLPNFASTLQWKSCDNLYFTTDKRTIDDPIIALNACNNSLVNNIFYPTSISNSGSGDRELLSVSVVLDHGLDESQLLDKVQQELKNDFNIDAADFLKRYEITEALPDIRDLKYQAEENENLLTDKIALAGDHLLNGSLNAAMSSGESAAGVAHRVLSDSLIHFGDKP